MQSTISPPAIRKLIAFALIASMATGVLLSGNAIANVKPVPREAAARSTKPVASNYPNLKRFARNLTQQARLGKLQAVSGYDAEIAHVVKTLSDSSRTPVLVGESNLDRSAIAQGLAIRIASGDVPAALRGKHIFSLSLDAIAASARTSQEFENCVQAIIAETEKSNGEVVLFIDELQEFAGKRATYVVSSTIKAALQDKNLRLLGAASPRLIPNTSPPMKIWLVSLNSCSSRGITKPPQLQTVLKNSKPDKLRKPLRETRYLPTCARS